MELARWEIRRVIGGIIITAEASKAKIMASHNPDFKKFSVP